VIGHEAGIGWAQSYRITLASTVYMGAVVLTGLGLRVGILSGPSPVAFTLIPAAVAGLIIVAALLIGYFGGELRETTERLHDPSRRNRWRAALATVPNTLAGGVRGAIATLRERPVNGLWAIGWWGFDIAVLWACLHAFGSPRRRA
jgi:hypothetical protein